MNNEHNRARQFQISHGKTRKAVQDTQRCRELFPEPLTHSPDTGISICFNLAGSVVFVIWDITVETFPGAMMRLGVRE